jgi:hypothetical protein
MSAALVEILMHALKSGSDVPARMPGSLRICLLIYSTIPWAAFPTDLIVKAEKRYGNIAPIKSPAKI